MRKILLIFLVFTFTALSVYADELTKKPNVSGQFYPANSNRLARDIEGYIASADVDPLDETARILFVPHAGYSYSAGVAAYGYKAASKGNYKAVVVIAPSHFYPSGGIFIWPEGGFETPLGQIAVDTEISNRILNSSKKVNFVEKAFDREHALEVQLPFIQKTFKDAKIVPILIGRVEYKDCEMLASVLSEEIGNREDVLVVISTDLSHYHSDKDARKIDKQTLSAVLASDAQGFWKYCRIGTMEACGYSGVTTALIYASKQGYEQKKLLRYATSGDVSWNKGRVVGYASIIFYNNKPLKKESPDSKSSFTEKQQKRLIKIARQSVETYLKTGKMIDIKESDPRLMTKEGVFVTLNKNGKLRGCIGHIIARAPLYKTVRDVAISAAVKDARFKPVTKEELKDINIEVSVLSVPERIKDPAIIIPGVHGVIVTRGIFNRGVFLPEVATDFGWSREQFLSNLCSHKAGLPPDAWKDPKTKLEIFTTEKFSEKDFK